VLPPLACCWQLLSALLLPRPSLRLARTVAAKLHRSHATPVTSCGRSSAAKHSSSCTLLLYMPTPPRAPPPLLLLRRLLDNHPALLLLLLLLLGSGRGSRVKRCREVVKVWPQVVQVRG
jgi:hypothetical protein